MGQKKIASPHELNLGGIVGTFKLSANNIIRESFVKTKLPPLISPYFTTNTQACVASVQVSSGYKDEDINGIEHRNISLITVQEIRTDDPMVVLQSKYVQQLSRNISLRAAVHNTVNKQTATPTQ